MGYPVVDVLRARDRSEGGRVSAPVVPDRDTEAATALATLVLFTVEPTDRALAGWDPAGWADEELAALRRYVAAARGSGVMP